MKNTNHRIWLQCVKAISIILTSGSALAGIINYNATLPSYAVLVQMHNNLDHSNGSQYPYVKPRASTR